MENGRGSMNKMDLGLAFQLLNDEMDMNVNKYLNGEITALEYYKEWWLRLDSLIRDYLDDGKLQIVRELDTLIDLAHGAKIRADVYKEGKGKLTDRGRNLILLEYLLSQALDIFEEIVDEETLKGD